MVAFLTQTLRRCTGEERVRRQRRRQRDGGLKASHSQPTMAPKADIKPLFGYNRTATLSATQPRVVCQGLGRAVTDRGRRWSLDVILQHELFPPLTLTEQWICILTSAR